MTGEHRDDYVARFERNPAVCGGQTVIKGTRVLVRTILASLAEGSTTEELLADFPTLSEEDVKAVAAFATATK